MTLLTIGLVETKKQGEKSGPTSEGRGRYAYSKYRNQGQQRKKDDTSNLPHIKHDNESIDAPHNNAP